MNRIYLIADTLLATMARPRGGDWLQDDLMSLKKREVTVLVCLLEKEEMYELQLEEEANDCKKAGMEWIHFPIADFGLPTNEKMTNKLILQLKEYVESGKKVVIHCRMGIGRSSTIAAATLVALGTHTTETAFEAITIERGLRVPDTQQQIDWVKRFEQWHENF
ncbi:MAG: dual specificity protein phosphatase family protein [Chitinophagales bacterium]